jgi:hypothetical protein
MLTYVLDDEVPLVFFEVMEHDGYFVVLSIFLPSSWLHLLWAMPLYSPVMWSWSLTLSSPHVFFYTEMTHPIRVLKIPFLLIHISATILH